MSAATLRQLMNDIAALPQDVQIRLRDWLRARSAPDDARRGLFFQDLVQAGLLIEPRTPAGAAVAVRQRVDVPGKPLSESVIEDRR